MTIQGAQPAAAANETAPSFIAANVATYDPNAPPSVAPLAPQGKFACVLLPAGVAAPSFDRTPSQEDPAIILEDNQQAFVSFE